MDERMTVIIVSNIVWLRKDGRVDEIEPYFEMLNKHHGITREDWNICCGLAIKNMERLGVL